MVIAALLGGLLLWKDFQVGLLHVHFYRIYLLVVLFPLFFLPLVRWSQILVFLLSLHLQTRQFLSPVGLPVARLWAPVKWAVLFWKALP